MDEKKIIDFLEGLYELSQKYGIVITGFPDDMAHQATLVSSDWKGDKDSVFGRLLYWPGQCYTCDEDLV